MKNSTSNLTEKEELKRIINTVEKIWDSDEYKNRRSRQLRYLKYYCGQYWDQDDDDEAKESKVFANLIFSTVMTIAPMLTDNKPIWSLMTEYPFLQGLANVYKSAGDALWEAEELDVKIFETVLDSLISDFGIMQVSFDPDRTVRGELAFDVIDPVTYFQAPGFSDNWQAPMSGTKTTRSLWWIRANFPETGKEVKKESDKKETAGEKLRGIFKGKLDCEYLGDSAEVYTIWMRDDTVIEVEEENKEGKIEKVKKPKFPNGRFLVCTKEVKLHDIPYPYNHGKPPWVILKDYVIPHQFYGMGETQQIEGLVLEYNLCLRELCTHVRMYSRPDHYVEDGCGIDADEYKEKMLSKKPQVWQIQPGTNPPGMVQWAPMDVTATNVVNGLPTVIQDVSGVTDVSKGMASKKQRQSAHEISALLETSYTRTRQRVRNLEAFIKRMYTLVVEIMMQFYSESRPFSIRNQDAQTEWNSIKNTAEFAKTRAKPGQELIEKPGMEEDEDYQDLKQQWQDYNDLVAYIGDEKNVHFKFQVVVETNSTLPMDKQALANLGLQLGQQGRLDTRSLLEKLHWPNPDQVIERLKQEAQERAQMAAPQGAMPSGGMM